MITSTGLTFDQYRTMRDQNQVAELAAYSPVRLNVAVDGALEPTVEGQLISGGYFSLLGVNPAAGRSISLEDDRLPNGHPVAMISYGYWKRRFGQETSIIGRNIAISGTKFTVIGVTLPEFFGLEVGSAPDIFVPVMMQPSVTPAVENLLLNPIIFSPWLQPVMRFKNGVQPARAAESLTVLFQQGVPRGPKFGALQALKLKLLPAATGLSDLRRQFSQPLFVLMGIVGIVLLIACANTANLLLAREASRRAEFAMRLSLGASRWRVINQLLMESVLLAAFGGLLGVLLARWAAQVLVTFMSSGRTPIVLDLTPDLTVLSFTAAVSVGTGILFGLAPALRATRIDLAPALKNVRGSASPGGGGFDR